MEKRGLSSVVTTVLIILLVIVAVGIIWVAVSRILSESSREINVETFSATIKVVPNSVKAITNKENSVVLSFLAKMSGGNEEITALNVIVEDSSGVSKNYKYIPSGGKFVSYQSQKIFTSFEGLEDVAKISLIPVLKDDKGKEINAKVSTIYKLQEGEFLDIKGLVGYWKFDDGTGTTAKDSSINHFDATLSANGASFASAGCKQGGCLQLDGASGYANVPFQSALNTPGFTVVAWAKSSATPPLPAYQAVVSSRGSPTPLKGYAIYAVGGPPSIWQVWFGNGGTSWIPFPPSGSSVSANSWIHLGAVYDGTKMKFYSDGVSNNEFVSGYSPNTNKPFRVGVVSDDSLSQHFKGQIDEVMVFNRALSNTEIDYIYQLFR